MRRIGRDCWTLGKVRLVAAVLAVSLLSAVACDQQSVVTQRPATTPEPVATPQRIIREEVESAPDVDHTVELSQVIPPCGHAVTGGQGSRGGGVAWISRGLTGDEIVFTHGLEVYAVGVDGRGLRMVSQAADAGAPPDATTTLDISPDGREVVYAPCESRSKNPVDLIDYEQELAVASLDGGQVWRLTDNWYFDKYPSWSPDGSRIAFVSRESRGRRTVPWAEVDLFTMAADGTDVREIAKGPVVHETPQWSPDGERLAYAKFDDRGMDGRPPEIYIYVVAADGGRAQRLTEAVSAPSWSPDGERIAFAKVDGDEIALYVIAADGTDARRLGAVEGWQGQVRDYDGDPARAWIEKVSWSPEGSRILVLVDQYAIPGIYMMGADGSGITELRVRQPYPYSIADVEWSPDGMAIAMVGTFGRLPSNDPEKSIALVTIGVDGTDVRVLAGRQAEGRPVGLAVVAGDISAEVAACGEGVAVPDPEANPGLVEDCEALLAVQNALAGPSGLNWHVDRDISEWEGIVVDGSPPRVREIVLGLRDTSGWISPELSRLTELRVLHMSHNGMMGEIPSKLGELKNLEHLDLGGNYLSGEIPGELGKLSGLTYLSLQRNYLSGEIPGELAELSRLTYLSLGVNSLEGKIPGELGELSGLTHLSLGGNSLEGEIPGELGRLTELRHLNLSGNQLTGEIPGELGRLTNLEWLHLHYNRLTGQIPAELGQLTKLKELIFTVGLRVHELGIVDNQFTGCIPAELREVENTDAGALGLPDCE